MESASEFAERYFNDPFKKKGCLEKMVEARDAAIRAECADRAVKWRSSNDICTAWDCDDAKCKQCAELSAAIMGDKHE